MNRGVTGFLPPPGGAHAAQIVTSWMEKRGEHKNGENFAVADIL